MNKDHVKIENPFDKEELFERANKIFSNNLKINEIPVTDDMGKLLYVLKRKGLKRYKFEILEGALNLYKREKLQKLLDLFEKNGHPNNRNCR